MSRLRSSVLARIVVVGLLLWAGSDLAFPSLCAEDTGGANQTTSSPADPGTARPDDCFCCCHHVVPVNFDVATVVLLSIDATDAPAVRPSFGIPATIFHPPLTP